VREGRVSEWLVLFMCSAKQFIKIYYIILPGHMTLIGWWIRGRARGIPILS